MVWCYSITNKWLILRSVLTVLLESESRHSLAVFSYIFTLCIYLFCPVSHKLPDKLLIVKQASDMPAVQKSRHRIDPDAIPSPVSFLYLSFPLFIFYLLPSVLCLFALTAPPPRFLSSQRLKVCNSHKSFFETACSNKLMQFYCIFLYMRTGKLN